MLLPWPHSPYPYVLPAVLVSRWLFHQRGSGGSGRLSEGSLKSRWFQVRLALVSLLLIENSFGVGPALGFIWEWLCHTRQDKTPFSPLPSIWLSLKHPAPSTPRPTPPGLCGQPSLCSGFWGVTLDSVARCHVISRISKFVVWISEFSGRLLQAGPSLPVVSPSLGGGAGGRWGTPPSSPSLAAPHLSPRPLVDLVHRQLVPVFNMGGCSPFTKGEWPVRTTL